MTLSTPLDGVNFDVRGKFLAESHHTPWGIFPGSLVAGGGRVGASGFAVGDGGYAVGDKKSKLCPAHGNPEK